MKKKILVVLPTLGLGGGEKLAIDLANGLDFDKFDVTILSLYKSIGSINQKRINNEKVKSIAFNKKKGFDLKLLLQLVLFFIKEKPDVVHSHLNVLLYLVIPYLFSKNIIKVHTVHSIASKESSGVNKYISMYCFKFLKVIPVSISNIVQKSVIEYYNINSAQSPVIYNGVNDNIFMSKSKEREINKVFEFITVGTLYNVKNHKFMIQAFQKVFEKDKNIRLTIVGDGVLRRELEQYLLQENLEKVIEIVGKTNDVSKFLLKSDCFLSTSNFEGLPLSIIEALMCSLPVIAVNVGGISDIVIDNINGILVENHSLELFSSAMLRIINDLEFYKKCQKGTSAIIDKCSLSKCIESYEGIYLRVENYEH